MLEKIHGERIEYDALLLRKQPLEVGLAYPRLTRRIGVMEQLAEPELVDLGKGPTIERDAALVPVPIVEHAQKCPAKQGPALLLLADQNVGEAFEPRQNGYELMPHGLVLNVCSHAPFPRRSGEFRRLLREGASLHANQEDSTSADSRRALQR